MKANPASEPMKAMRRREATSCARSARNATPGTRFSPRRGCAGRAVRRECADAALGVSCRRHGNKSWVNHKAARLGAALAVNAMLAGARKPHEGMLATALGLATLLFAAIGVVVQLKDALNTVWDVEAPPGRGVWSFLRTYLISLAGVLSLGFLLLISLLFTTALAAAGKYFAPYLPEATMQMFGSVASFAIITLPFAMMFKWLPDTHVAWRDVWVGAAITAALFELGKFLIGFYIGKQGLESTYGAAASLVILLIWVYCSSQIVLLGAEFTHVYAKRRGSRKVQMTSARAFPNANSEHMDGDNGPAMFRTPAA
jgi:YihY family inner membrane protein